MGTEVASRRDWYDRNKVERRESRCNGEERRGWKKEEKVRWGRGEMYTDVSRIAVYNA